MCVGGGCEFVHHFRISGGDFVVESVVAFVGLSIGLSGGACL